MKTSAQSPVRILSLSFLVAFAVTSCRQKAEHVATSAEEIAALRSEVVALREEVAQLRRGKRPAALAAEVPDETSSAATDEDLVGELRLMRDQVAAAQREVKSNLAQIAVDRGGDAWKRGDFKEALKILKPLAEDGHPIAAHRLGVMYVLGQGVPKDSAEAIKYFTQAAEQGQGESQHSLGLRYLWGDGAERNTEAAAAWFSAAANQGISDSATWLGDMYWSGSGVEQDPVEAYKWMILSGDKFTINHRNGVTLDQFASQLTPAQKAEAEQRARDFVPQRTGPEDF